ncbi:PQQ-dependent catabolism-associated CXXCW motif protein [Pseudoxanthobacter sp. M-2]
MRRAAGDAAGRRGSTAGVLRPAGLLAAMVLLLAAGSWIAPATLAADVPEPDGYRMEEYRAPVPDTLAGATVLDTARAEALWKGGAAIFVDAMPRPVKPANLPAGTVWHDKPRTSIEGSHWLINTGYGQLPPEAQTYFEGRLASLTKDDKATTLVFFCEPECWMSWNAAKRALSLGYTDVRWYPGGATEWAAAGLPTAQASPVP